MFNRAQPLRPDYTEDGQPLLYRTQPKKQKRHPKFYSAPQMIAAMRLYRASHADAIPENVAIVDLYEYALGDVAEVVSKNAMGNAVIAALLYEPRKLKNNKAVEKPTMIYAMLHKLDLRYGLEWQICAPLYHWFLMQKDWPKEEADWIPRMEETLDEIANSGHREYLSLYEEPLLEDAVELMFKEPDWEEIQSKFPERQIQNKVIQDRQPPEERTPPRDMSNPKPRSQERPY